MRRRSLLALSGAGFACAVVSFGFTAGPSSSGFTTGGYLAGAPATSPQSQAPSALAFPERESGRPARALARGDSPPLAAYGTRDDERHVCLTFPVPRVGANCTSRSPQKVGPCGVAGRSQNVNEFQPGETITVQFNETVNHPSHYRISFNPNGDAFPDPTSVDDKAGGALILFNGIPDDEAAQQQIQITFPSVECANCTLQLIQVMYDKGDNGFGGRTAEGGNDDIYYSCADIVLRRR